MKDLESRYVLANEARWRGMGMKSADELLGKSDFDFHFVNRTDPSFLHAQEVMRTGKEVLDRRCRVLSRVPIALLPRGTPTQRGAAFLPPRPDRRAAASW